jgi:hypothetical protein
MLPNGERLREQVNAIADLETRKRMCAAELHAVLEKYDMVALAKETRVNGQVVHFEIAVQPKDRQQQDGRIAVPMR